jgi:hypothetical protein
MKRIFIICLLPILLAGQTSPVFDEYFSDHTMRIDYYHSGDARQEDIQMDQIYRQGAWAGNPERLLDPFNNGKYYVMFYDLASNNLIFSKGYNTYFSEYQTTDKAIKGVKRTYHETILAPYPIDKVLMLIQVRDRQNILRPFFSTVIDPSDYHIIRETPQRADLILKPLQNGDPHKKVDLVILSEGYSAEEQNKFKEDLEKRVTLMFGYEPYKSRQDEFNIFGVFSPSSQSGVDEPRENIYRKSVLNASFNALDLERYLLTEDNRTMRDMAGQVPYDAVMIMVNHQRYGGGGIYNQYAIFTAASPFTEKVFIHEFGHSFAGLADEYYGSSVSYNDFYPAGIEPTEPNITSLLNPDRPKWKNEVMPGKALPTEWQKAEYDSLAGVKDSYKLRAQFMKRNKLHGKVGFFEGAGYSSKGLYRPMLDCIMFSNESPEFCEVCRQAIQRMINYYVE